MTSVFEKVQYFEENANFTFRNNICNYFSLNKCFCTALCTYVLEKEVPETWIHYHNEEQWMFFRNEIGEILGKMVCDNIQMIIQENIKNPFISWLIKKYLTDEQGLYLVKIRLDLQSCFVSVQCQKETA